VDRGGKTPELIDPRLVDRTETGVVEFFRPVDIGRATPELKRPVELGRPELVPLLYLPELAEDRGRPELT